MEENFFWNVFEKTGMIESYLGYKESSYNEGENKDDDKGEGTDIKG
ncbi:MAG: YqzL family protein [Ruminococcaceae bacterium]|nr:YqzL family protein [Oscillospiraceae bacterium]